MPEGRDDIPNELERQLMLEVGYRCPLCHETSSLVIEHIEEYSKVQKHEFSNMIVLCANCHGRKKKTSNPRDINRASLRELKQKLMILNGRYSDVERRLLEGFQRYVLKHPDKPPMWVLPDTMSLMVTRLGEDGLAEIETRELGQVTSWGDGFKYHHGIIVITLTKKGREFVDNLNAVTAIE